MNRIVPTIIAVSILLVLSVNISLTTSTNVKEFREKIEVHNMYELGNILSPYYTGKVTLKNQPKLNPFLKDNRYYRIIGDIVEEHKVDKYNYLIYTTVFSNSEFFQDITGNLRSHQLYVDDYLKLHEDSSHTLHRRNIHSSKVFNMMEGGIELWGVE